MDTRLATPITPEELACDKPLLLLDIDGVLNAYDHALAADDVPTWPRYVTRFVTIPDDMADERGRARGIGYDVTWAPGLTEAIRTMASRDDVETVWLTSWNAYANHLANVCFWPGEESPVTRFLDTDSHRFRPNYLGQKYARIAEVLFARLEAGVRAPVVDVDDEHVDVLDHARFMSRRAREVPEAFDARMWDAVAEAPYVAQTTNPAYGMTPSELNEVRRHLGI